MLNLSHKNLVVYKTSLIIVDQIYETTQAFPREEQYNLVSQMRRAAVSVSSNIAEGAARISGKEKKRFYEIARSSVVEIDTQLEISILRKYIANDKINVLEKAINDTFNMLSRMISNLKDNTSTLTPF